MQLKRIKIGNLHTENNVFLAPLAGYTNAVFRQICFDLGAGLTFTEMVSAKGLCYNSEKTRELLSVTPEYGGIKACQIFGSDPEIMRRAAESEDLAPFDLIDINMGCPMPKIYNNGEGSALMGNLALAERVISAVKKSGKAVSVKFRIGLTEDKLISAEFAKMCEGAGADLITVHGRTRDKIYAGGVNVQQIAAAKNAVKIPVIANGGVFSWQDAQTLLARTGADGIALARGALYNPWLFCDITKTPVGDKIADVKAQLRATQKLYGERFACVFMRKMLSFYLKGQKNSAALRATLMQCADCTQILQILDTVSL
jgi:nifR3 family TIM-barrel protein